MTRIAAILATIVWLGPQPGAKERVVKAGEDGTITLGAPTGLADLQLKPGRYEFSQRIDHGDRLLHVMEIKRYALPKRRARDSKKFVADVACRLEPLEPTATETAVHLRPDAGGARIDWITLAAEDGRFIPQAVAPSRP